MKYVLMMMMALGLVLPGSAGEREENLLNGLFGLGARVLEVQAARAAAADATASGQGEAEPAPATPAQPAVVPPAPPATTPPLSMAQMLVAPIRQTIDGLINEYKEAYKEEVRIYAHELGTIVVERVVQDPEINSTITSLRTLCWVVIAYLTLVTLIMLGCLVYLKRANARLLMQVQELCREVKQG